MLQQDKTQCKSGHEQVINNINKSLLTTVSKTILDVEPLCEYGIFFVVVGRGVGWGLFQGWAVTVEPVLSGHPRGMAK